MQNLPLTDRPLSDEAARVLAGGGNMGELMRQLDWSKTPLGPVEGWPQSLRTTVSTCLNSRFPILVWWGPQLVKLYNDGYAPILGAKHPSALGRPGRDVWPEIWNLIGPMLDGVLERGEATWSENTLLPLERFGFAEECYFTFSYSPIRDEEGAVGGIFTAVTETTAQILSERRLRTLHALAERTAGIPSVAATLDGAMKAIAENAADLPFAALYTFDGAAAHVAGSTGLATMRADASPETLLSLTRRGLVPLGDIAGPLQLSPLAATAPKRATALPIQRGGSDVPYGVLLCGLSPMLAFDPRYEHFLMLLAQQIGTAIDTVRAGEDARQRAEALAELDRAKTTFFSNVSHEFRTPLTLILGPMEDALAAGALAGESLETAHRNALRLQKLVNALLDFSRIGAGRMRARYVPTDLAQVTEDLGSTFESAMTRAGLRYAVRCDRVTGSVFVDRDMYEQIVLNLLSNALKFTFEGEVELSLRDFADRVELRVRDTGVGVPEAEVARLFERFHRIEGTRARTHEGSGIGLALVSDLVKLHGGAIEAASVVGRGTTFTVRLPKGARHLPADKVGAAGESASERTAPRAFVEEALRWLPTADERVATAETAAGDARAPATILVADDNADMRNYLRRVLEPSWNVVCVPDGVAALAAVRKTPPDLVLADVMMPNLDGFGLLDALRGEDATKGIPVVMLSARAGEEARIEGLQAGADDYLVKPFSARELTARVRTRLEIARLRRAAELQYHKLNELFEYAPAVICIVSGPDHVYRFANQPYRDAVGNRDIIGKPIREALPEMDGSGIYELLDTAFATGERVARSEVFTTLERNGRLEDTYWNLVYQPYRDADGRVEGVMVFGFEVTTQVTARQRAEALTHEVEMRKSDAEAASRAKDEFLAVLGHELRNPLAPILTALHIMRLRDGEQSVNERSIIERQAQHLVRLVDDLLDVSRITRGKVELKRRRIEAAYIVAHAIEMASPLLEQRRQKLSVEVPSRGLVIDGDPERLGQVVANLLTNAAKYTPHAGHIAVSAREAAGEIVIAVRDSGIGIAPEMLPRVFEMFVQERQALDRAQGGLGLGLTIVRSLVGLHGGSVEVHSEGRGRGAEFVVKLPAAATTDDFDDETTAVSKPPVATTGKKILIVDDNEDAAELLATALQLMGHRTLVAHDGPEALKLVPEFSPDIAMLDIGLPVMDGYELARRLRDEPHVAPIRLIAVTGYGQETDRQRSQSAGFDAHLVKPIDVAQLPAVIQELSAAAAAD